MNLLDIDAVSYATRVGQTAASDVARLLWFSDDTPEEPLVNWYEASPGTPEHFIMLADAGVLVDEETGQPIIEKTLDELGGEVCRQGITRGEWLWREALERHIAPAKPHWADMAPAQRMAWETFVTVTLQAYGHLRAVQLALEEAGRPQPGTIPVKLARADSIFEEEESLGALRPEAVEALRNSDAYSRAAEERRDELRTEQEQADARSAAAVKAAATRKAKQAKKAGDQVQVQTKPAPMSVGEPPVKPPRNKGGRGNKKPETAT